MITTLSKQGGRRHQMGNTSFVFAGRLLSIGITSAPPVPVDGSVGGGGVIINTQPEVWRASYVRHRRRRLIYRRFK